VLCGTKLQSPKMKVDRNFSVRISKGCVAIVMLLGSFIFSISASSLSVSTMITKSLTWNSTQWWTIECKFCALYVGYVSRCHGFQSIIRIMGYFCSERYASYVSKHEMYKSNDSLMGYQESSSSSKISFNVFLIYLFLCRFLNEYFLSIPHLLSYI
jgi:hypothetical protein